MRRLGGAHCHQHPALPGAEREGGLDPRQRHIYEYIKERGGAPAEQIAAALGLTAEEVRREFAVLRHCELGRAEKRGDQVYLVPWE